MERPLYEHKKTRLDISIKDSETVITQNYSDNVILPTQAPVINLLTVFKHPENYVLHIHDYRDLDKDDEERLSFEY